MPEGRLYSQRTEVLDAEGTEMVELVDCRFICAWISGVFTVLHSNANVRRSERGCVMIKLKLLVNMPEKVSRV